MSLTEKFNWRRKIPEIGVYMHPENPIEHQISILRMSLVKSDFKFKFSVTFLEYPARLENFLHFTDINQTFIEDFYTLF